MSLHTSKKSPTELHPLRGVKRVKEPTTPKPRSPIAPVGKVGNDHREIRREFRALILLRDNRTCQRCGGLGDEVHHLYTKAAHPELQYDQRNVLLLCRSCHKHGPKAAHKDPAAFNRWAADAFPRFAPLYAQFGKGDAYEAWVDQSPETPLLHAQEAPSVGNPGAV